VAPVGATEALSEGTAEKDIQPQKAIPYQWILNPTIDLLFCCGGLLWLVYLANALVKSHLPAANTSMILLTLAGTHLLSETHTAATLERLHESEPTRKALNKFGVIASIICFFLAAASLVTPNLPAIFAKIYLIWIVQHFMAQTYGRSEYLSLQSMPPLPTEFSNSLRLESGLWINSLDSRCHSGDHFQSHSSPLPIVP
jgi:hypothetical protein